MIGGYPFMCICGKKYINPHHFERHQKKCPQSKYGKTFIGSVFMLPLQDAKMQSLHV